MIKIVKLSDFIKKNPDLEFPPVLWMGRFSLALRRSAANRGAGKLIN